jgi:hypothetical protein
MRPHSKIPARRAAECYDDQRWFKEVCAIAGGDEPSHQRGRQPGRDGRGRSIRRSYGEGKRTAQRNDERADRGREKCNRDTVGKPRRQRPGKDERRIRQAGGNRQYAADRTGKNIPKPIVKNSSCRLTIADRKLDGHPLQLLSFSGPWYRTRPRSPPAHPVASSYIPASVSTSKIPDAGAAKAPTRSQESNGRRCLSWPVTPGSVVRRARGADITNRSLHRSFHARF